MFSSDALLKLLIRLSNKSLLVIKNGGGQIVDDSWLDELPNYLDFVGQDILMSVNMYVWWALSQVSEGLTFKK